MCGDGHKEGESRHGFTVLERELKEACEEGWLFEGVDKEFPEKATGVFWEAPKDRECCRTGLCTVKPPEDQRRWNSCLLPWLVEIGNNCTILIQA